MRFNRTSDSIVSTSDDGTVRVWSVATGIEELNIDVSLSTTTSACFNDIGDTIAVAHGSLVNLFDALTGELKQSLAGHEDLVSSVQFSQDGRMLVSGSDDKKSHSLGCGIW